VVFFFLKARRLQREKHALQQSLAAAPVRVADRRA